MKCLDNIYTKQIKYNSPVLYQLESLKKEYEKLLKVSNEIIKTGSFIEECYFENQSAVLSDNEITFSGNLKFKTDAGNYFSTIPSSLKLNVQGTGEIVVDVGEDNKTLVFKLDEKFLSEISLMIKNLETLTTNFNELKAKFNSQIFDNFIGIRNTSDLKIDQIKHINNNFQITSNDEKSLLNIDEQLEKIYSFNKEISFADASNLTEENVASWKEKLKYENIDVLYNSKSTDSAINLGYTGGLANGTTINIDTNKYKKVIIYGEVWNEQFNTICTATIDFDVSNGASNIVDGFVVDGITYFDIRGGYVNSERTTFTAYCKRIYNNVKFDSGTINKIEGVY